MLDGLCGKKTSAFPAKVTTTVKSRDYELATRGIFQQLLNQESIPNILVEHDCVKSRVAQRAAEPPRFMGLPRVSGSGTINALASVGYSEKWRSSPRSVETPCRFVLGLVLKGWS
jgi:hypothetical protein